MHACSHIKHKISLFLLLFSTATYIAAEEQQHDPVEMSIDRRNELYAIAMQKVDQAQSIIQHCAQLINNKKLKPQDEQLAREWLQASSKVLLEIKNSPYAPLTDTKIIEILTETKQFAQLFIPVISSNFNNLPEMSRDMLKTRYIPTDISEKMMFEYVAYVDRALEDLQATANNVGQNIINKTYNTLSALNSHYKFGNWVGNTALVGFGAATALYVTPRPILAKIGLGDVQDTMVDTLGYMINKRDVYTLPYLVKKIKNGVEGNYPKQAIVTPHEYFASTGNLSRLMMAGSAWMAYLAAQDAWHKSRQYWPWPQLDKKLSNASSAIQNYLEGTTLNTYGVDAHVIEDLTLEDDFFKGFDAQLNKFKNILTFVEDPRKFIFSGMKINKALLLTGASGTGKSFFAKAFAGSINKIYQSNDKHKKVEFIEISHFMLQSEANPLAIIMTIASMHAPCVIYIDEFHLLQLQVQGDAKRLSEFLMALDKLDKDDKPNSQIFIIGATNRPDLLDPALIRDGRFETVQFHNPTFEQRKNLLETLCKKSAIDMTGIDFELLAHLTEHYSFSALNKLFERAAFVAKNQGEGVSFKHLYQALNDVIRKLKNDLPTTVVEKNIVATYQAGKALAHVLLPTTVNLESVTIQGYTKPAKEIYDWQAKVDKKDIKKQYKPKFGTLFTWKNYEVILTETVEQKETCAKS